MAVISSVGKIIIIIVNIFILLLSLSMLICGIVVVAGKDLYSSLLDSMESDLKESLEKLGLDVDLSDLSLSDLMLSLAYGVIALGVLMGTLSLMGCVGACCSLKCVLIVYVIITTALFVAQVVVVALIYLDKGAFDDTAKPRIKDTLDKYSGINGTETETLAWNAIMNYAECCGVDSYRDFRGLKHWPPEFIRRRYNITLETPIICCKKKSKDYSCAQKANETNNWLDKGCYNKLFDLIVENEFVVSVIIILLICESVLIFFTIWLLCNDRDK